MRVTGRRSHLLLAGALDALFGVDDEPTMRASDDPELAAVKRRVQEKLPAIRAAFQKGLPVRDHLAVKAPFTTDDGGVEWMWISVTGWQGDVVRGNLDNDAYEIKALEAGAPPIRDRRLRVAEGGRLARRGRDHRRVAAPVAQDLRARAHLRRSTASPLTRTCR